MQVRLKATGFDWEFVRSHVLPDWWEDEMATFEANRMLAEAYIAKQLGFRIEDMHDRNRPLALPKIAEVRFKRYKNQVDDKVRVSTIVALRAASAVVRTTAGKLPKFADKLNARAIRDAILRRSSWVDLESLLDFCWEYGVPVLQLARTPAGSKRFSGMAALVEGRPVIVLASGRDGPPWLAFHVAHELGHIMLGHVQEGTSVLVDTSLENSAGTNDQEREADQFACELVSGFREPIIKDLKKTAPELAALAAGQGPKLGVDPGVLALIYARSNNRWGVAQNALKYLRLDAGGQATVIRYLDRYLADAEPSETDEIFLSVLGAQ